MRKPGCCDSNSHPSAHLPSWCDKAQSSDIRKRTRSEAGSTTVSSTRKPNDSNPPSRILPLVILASLGFSFHPNLSLAEIQVVDGSVPIIFGWNSALCRSRTSISAAEISQIMLDHVKPVLLAGEIPIFHWFIISPKNTLLWWFSIRCHPQFPSSKSPATCSPLRPGSAWALRPARAGAARRRPGRATLMAAPGRIRAMAGVAVEGIKDDYGAAYQFYAAYHVIPLLSTSGDGWFTIFYGV